MTTLERDKWEAADRAGDVRTGGVRWRIRRISNLNIDGDDNTRRATDSAAANFDRLQRKVDSFSTSKPSAETKRLAKQIDESMRDGETSFQSIQRSIDETRNGSRSFVTSSAPTGSSSIFGDLKGAQRDLKGLENILASVGSSAGLKAGEDFTAVVRECPGVADRCRYRRRRCPGHRVGAVRRGRGWCRPRPDRCRCADPEEQPADSCRRSACSKTTRSTTFKGATAGLAQPFADALDYADALVVKEGPQLQAMFHSVAPAVDLIAHGLGWFGSGDVAGAGEAG